MVVVAGFGAWVALEGFLLQIGEMARETETRRDLWPVLERSGHGLRLVIFEITDFTRLTRYSRDC